MGGVRAGFDRPLRPFHDPTSVSSTPDEPYQSPTAVHALSDRQAMPSRSLLRAPVGFGDFCRTR
jgi:hypothetical protein